MSVFVKGDLTTYRAVDNHGVPGWLWKCPACGTWASLSNEQWLGNVSVDHGRDGCTGGYHETHSFAADLERYIDNPDRSAAE